MATISNKNYAKLCSKFYCDFCDYGTSKKSSYANHCQSKKHKNNESATFSNQNYAKLCSEKKYTCENCNNLYNDRTGLWRHKKKCTQIIENNDKDKLVVYLLQQNSDLHSKLIEITKDKNITTHSVTNNTNNIINSNIINNSFNLNFFLNETCKNAMNITDFVSSIELNVADLENTGKKGYIEGISNIIVRNLNNLEECFRPIHCSDFKREIMYIKDNDKWEKETTNKPILKKAIKTIANENIKQIQHWKDKNPDCIESSSKKNDLYLKIVSNSMSGGTDEECDKNLNRIITNVAKQTIIQKNNNFIQ
jgi:hypothetical protein